MFSLLCEKNFLLFICYLSLMTIFSFWLFSYSYINCQFQVKGNALVGIRTRSSAWKAPTLSTTPPIHVLSLSLFLIPSLALTPQFLTFTISLHFFLSLACFFSLTLCFKIPMAENLSLYVSFSPFFIFSNSASLLQVSLFLSLLLSLSICKAIMTRVFIRQT